MIVVVNRSGCGSGKNNKRKRAFRLENIMIRDEFKNADKKTIEQKAKVAKSVGNEREYYAKKMSKINSLFAPVKFSTIFCLVCFLLMSALYILTIAVSKEYKIDWVCITVLSITAALVIWTVVWFAVLVPHLKKRAAFCKSELERISREYVLKRAGKA